MLAEDGTLHDEVGRVQVWGASRDVEAGRPIRSANERRGCSARPTLWGGARKKWGTCRSAEELRLSASQLSVKASHLSMKNEGPRGSVTTLSVHAVQ